MQSDRPYMRANGIVLVVLLAVACHASGCGDDAPAAPPPTDDDDDDDDTGGPICGPGATRACACPGGLEGSQACALSGDNWLACECDDDTTGMSGLGGVEESTSTSGPPPDEPCFEGDWAGSWSGQVGPGCGLHPDWEVWADALTFFWSTQPAYICQADWTQTSCLGQRFDGYWYDPGDAAILMLNSTTLTLNARAPAAAAVSLTHEWGHVNQQWLGNFAGCAPLLPLPQLELEADCYGGFASAFLENGQLYDSAAILYSSGCGIFDPAHGTCGQRWCAFEGGYQTAIANAADACSDPLAFAAEACPLIVSSCI